MTPASRNSFSVRVTAGWLLLCLLSVGLLSLGASIAMRSGLAWPCPALTLFHFPCPSCGTTRALACLARGDLASALAYNPLMTLACGVALFLPFARFRALLGRLGWPLLAAAVLINWTYLLIFLPR